MKKQLLSNNLRMLVWIISGTCLISTLAYLFIPKIDKAICYERLANNLSVQPTSASIRNALYEDLHSELTIGLTYDQSFSALGDTWDYEIIWGRSDLGGGYKEYIRLNHCSFATNDFTFLLVFSKDGTLANMLNYIDD